MLKSYKQKLKWFSDHYSSLSKSRNNLMAFFTCFGFKIDLHQSGFHQRPPRLGSAVVRSSAKCSVGFSVARSHHHGYRVSASLISVVGRSHQRLLDSHQRLVVSHQLRVVSMRHVAIKYIRQI